MATTQTFGYTGANQTFTVPTGVTSIQVTLKGAGGGNGTGGAGGLASGLLAVTAGQVLNIFVGSAGAANAGTTPGAGGYNGGGNGGSAAGTGAASGSGGGGASDIRIGGTAIGNRVAVAAGGGGAGAQAGGNGGGTTGGTGTAGGTSNGGVGGSQVAGGKAGSGSGGGQGTAGTQTAGGLGGTVSGGTNARGGGGGGGGYWGGGGGYSGIGAGLGGGGGGGSSYTGGLTSVTNTAAGGSAAGVAGSVVIVYDQAPIGSPSSPTSGTYFDSAAAQTFSWTFSDADTGDTQTSADLRYRVVGSPTWTTVAGIATTAASASIAGGTFTPGSQYEWQVQVYDQSSVASGWSASSIFNASSIPATPTITAPISQVNNNPTTVTWTITGTPQIAYQVRYVADNGSGTAVPTTVYSDTGQVNSGTLSASLGLGTAIQGGSLHVQVRYQLNPGLWSAWADSGVETINVGLPGVPTLTTVANPATASISITVTNPSAPNPTVANELFRTALTDVDLRSDYTAMSAVPTAADTGQPLVLAGNPLKIQSASLAMSFTGSGVQRSDVQYSLGKRVNRMRADFLIESAAWTTDGALLGLLALASPYLGGAVTPDSHCYLTVGRSTWALAYVSGTVLTSLISGSYTSLPLDTQLSVEVVINPYTNQITVYLPDGSIKTVTSVAVAPISGVVADALLYTAAANTDRRVRLLNFWGSDTADFGETRISSNLATNGTYVDYTPGSGRLYRYRAVAHALFGGSATSA